MLIINNFILIFIFTPIQNFPEYDGDQQIII